MDNKELKTVPGAEQVQVVRALLEWLNQYDGLPLVVKKIEAEFLPAESSGICLTTSTAAYKTQEYINGAYTAQLQFALAYRTTPTNSNQRLNAMDVLTEIAAWAESREDLPQLGELKTPISIERTSPAVMIARYEDGSEDYQILMVFIYEVKPY